MPSIFHGTSNKMCGTAWKENKCVFIDNIPWKYLICWMSFYYNSSIVVFGALKAWEYSLCSKITSRFRAQRFFFFNHYFNDLFEWSVVFWQIYKIPLIQQFSLYAPFKQVLFRKVQNFLYFSLFQAIYSVWLNLLHPSRQIQCSIK